MDKIADSVVAQAVEGNKDAWMEIANRIEGKVGTTVELIGNEDKPLVHKIERLVLDVRTPDTDS